MALLLLGTLAALAVPAMAFNTAHDTTVYIAERFYETSSGSGDPVFGVKQSGMFDVSAVCASNKDGQVAGVLSVYSNVTKATLLGVCIAMDSVMSFPGVAVFNDVRSTFSLKSCIKEDATVFPASHEDCQLFIETDSEPALNGTLAFVRSNGNKFFRNCLQTDIVIGSTTITTKDNSMDRAVGYQGIIYGATQTPTSSEREVVIARKHR